jgi:prepilin-type N-terminal cleavage/methylation domain-containing protein
MVLHRRKVCEGFSLIEVLIVIALIAIVVTMSFSYLISARPHAQLEQAEIVVSDVLLSGRSKAISEELVTSVKFDLASEELWVEWVDPASGSTMTDPTSALPEGVTFASSGFPASANGVVFTARGTLVIGGDITLISPSGETSTLQGNVATGKFPLFGGNLR